MRSVAADTPYRGERFAALKDIFKLTQRDLGERLDVTQVFISRVIRRDRPVPPALADKAAAEFDLPLSFFTVPPTPGEGAVPTFRKSSQASMLAERRVIQLHREAQRLWHHMSQESDYRDTSTMTSVVDKAGSGLEEMAQALREVVGVGAKDPIPNVTRFVEKLGVGVVTTLDRDYPIGPDGYSQHSGISTPSSLNRRPLISLVGGLPGGVQRLTIAHELGHLLLDRDRQARITSIRSVEERRAFAFAGALLMPEEAMRERVSELMTLRDYARLAADFGVSVPASIQRSRVLGLISESRNKSLQIQLNTMGWRKKDPVQIDPEKAVLLEQAAKRLWPVSTAIRASEHVGIAESWVKGWVGQAEDCATSEQLADIVSLDYWRQQKAGSYES